MLLCRLAEPWGQADSQWAGKGWGLDRVLIPCSLASMACAELRWYRGHCNLLLIEASSKLAAPRAQELFVRDSLSHRVSCGCHLVSDYFCALQGFVFSWNINVNIWVTTLPCRMGLTGPWEWDRVFLGGGTPPLCNWGEITEQRHPMVVT